MSKHPEISEKLDKFPIFQGEGTFTGEPCAFLRTAFCSLNCVFCDIPQSLAFDRYSIEEESHPMTLDEVFRAITATSKRVKHLTTSSSMSGVFREDSRARSEFLALVGQAKMFT
jgi:pyruvate-formate lyase-activating enzyme